MTRHASRCTHSRFMADLSGKTFGQYQLTEPISSGGMATIYKAYQPALDRVVAVKVLPEYLLAQAGFLERFKIEAQAIARLEHPNILPVYDYGEAERTPYLVMKYVPGGTLKDLMAQGPLDTRQTAQLLRQIAEALDYAHQQGIVHRDVKPSNVLLQDGKWALLMDFGLAKLLTSTSNITASGTGVGTPDYMSPEQAQGLPIDQRTDIYSLGIVLYQMLTGDVPFHADTPMAVMLKQIVETPSQPHLHNPNITPAVDDVIMKAIAKSPADRYARATDLAGAYEMALDSGATLPTARRSATTLSLSPAIERRRSPWPIVTGIALALIAVIAVVALVLSTRSNSAPSTVQLGATLLDDFSAATIDPTPWTYSGAFTTTLNSPAISIQNGRLTYRHPESDGSVSAPAARVYRSTKPFKLISTRMTLLDAAGSPATSAWKSTGWRCRPTHGLTGAGAIRRIGLCLYRDTATPTPMKPTRCCKAAACPPRTK